MTDWSVIFVKYSSNFSYPLLEILLSYSFLCIFYVINESAKVVNSLIVYMTQWATDELENGIEFHPPSPDAFTAISITLFSL
jgi:dipeptide/tripeptide permease